MAVGIPLANHHFFIEIIADRSPISLKFDF